MFAVDAASGVITTTAALDHEALAAYTITATATDTGGLSTSSDFGIAVTNVNETPVGEADAVAIDEDAVSPNLWTQLLGNDHDPDAGDTLAISAVDTAGTLGTVTFDAATQTLTYAADNDAFDYLATGDTATDTFTYTVTDADGLTSTAVVTMTVTAIADGVVKHGGWRCDTLYGTAGEDKLFGGFGKDKLYGLDGHDELHGGFGSDLLDGGTGNDALYGGTGNDTMIGGEGHDTFHFGWLGGHDTVTDFNTSEDTIVLEDGEWIAHSRVRDVNHDGVKDLVLTLGLGTSVTLLGVSDIDQVSIEGDNGHHGHNGHHGFSFGGLFDHIGLGRAFDFSHGF
ncbi:MAG: Ig-like domain-containing protein [Novosphingobium sp.]